MRIAVFGSRHQSEYLGKISSLFAALRRHGDSLAIETRFFNYIKDLLPDLEADSLIPDDEFAADFVFSIGGDGTFLRTAAKVRNKSIPIAGINTGHLGYLADVSIDNAETFIDDLHSGKYAVETRSIIAVDIDGNVDDYRRFALNEVAIQRDLSASMLHINTKINGKELTTYLGDGLIISTPTGSTAYNLSLGGPIIHPACGCFVASPIAAHSLTMRPIVLPDSIEIELTTTSNRSESFRISIDGKSVALPIGTTVRLRKADFQIFILQQQSHDFAKTLRNKLMWGADSR